MSKTSCWDKFLELEKSQETLCKRKLVVSALVEADDSISRYSVNGGPNCSDVVGSCGCIHAEQRLLIDLSSYEDLGWNPEIHIIQRYSPCTNCANLLLEFCEVKGYELKLEYLEVTEHDKRGLEILGEKAQRHCLSD